MSPRAGAPSSVAPSSGTTGADSLAAFDLGSRSGALLLGPSHPEVSLAVEEALRASGAPDAARRLAEALCGRLGRLAAGDSRGVQLTSSSGAALDEALKLARLITRRPRFVGCERGFHGTSLGGLSVGARERHRTRYEPLLESALVPYGSRSALDRALRRGDVAAFVVEPIQVEAGVRLPPSGYLEAAQALCRRHGALLIVDETRTGLGRTGRSFAVDGEGVEPDVIVVGDGLGAGLATIGALLVRPPLWQRARSSGAEGLATPAGLLACAAALAVIELLTRDRLAARAAAVGEELGIALRVAATASPLVHMVRGRGLLWGIELRPEEGLRTLTLGALDRVAGAVVPSQVAAGLAKRGWHIEPSLLAPEVLRIEPALTVDEELIPRFGAALAESLAERAPGVAQAALGALSDGLLGGVARVLGRKPDKP